VNAVEEYANLGASLAKELKALEERCVKKMEYRAKDPVKSGRTLSKATLDKLTAIKDKTLENLENDKKLAETLQGLLGLAEPKKETDTASVLQMEYAMARTQTELALSGAVSS